MSSHSLARFFHDEGGTSGGALPPTRALKYLKYRRPTALLTVALLSVLSVGLATALVGCSFPGTGNAGAKARSAPETPTPVAQGELAKAVMLNVWGLGVKQLQTVYQPQDASVTVTITLGGTVPTTPLEISAANELTKSFCLMALQALWTSGTHLLQTVVVVLGPTQNEYAILVNQAYGSVTIEASQARQIDWNTVTADAAWDAYGGGHEFLRGDFGVFD